MSLLPAHEARLAASGISPQVIKARGYFTAYTGAALGRLGYARIQQETPALVIPIWGPKGKTTLSQIRPDRPRIHKSRELKYEVPSGAKLLLDIPPEVLDKVLRPDTTLLITEGVLKADAAASRGLACIACLGVNGWSGDLVTWDALPLKGRRVLIAFDSDIRSNKQVQYAAGKLAEFLKNRAANVGFIPFLSKDDGSKVGLDDFLGSGKTEDDLYGLASPDLPVISSSEDEEDAAFLRYEGNGQGLFKVVVGKQGESRLAISNFSARIIAELIFVEEPDQPREFEIEARLNGTTSLITIAAGEFERMNWVIPMLGGEARIEAGFGIKDEVRAAIQFLSGTIRKVDTYGRLGWVKLRDGTWGYLHAGGIVVADSPAEKSPPPENRSDASPSSNEGSVQDQPKTTISRTQNATPEIRVRNLPASLGRYELFPATTQAELVRAVQISLGFLDLAPDRITFPLYAYLWRVVLDTVRFSLFLVGTTGLGKTEMSALIVQHLGPEMDSSHLPESFASTANALAATAYYCRNAPLIVDDFVPTGSQGKIQKAHDQVDQLLRGLGNQAGRNRCTRDGSTLGGRAPGGGFICSGEDSPQGQSLGARYLLEEFTEGDVFDKADEPKGARLTLYQVLAKEGWLAKAMTGFLQSIAPRYEQECEELQAQKRIFRDGVFRGKSSHPRVVDMAADLLAGIEPFLYFALDIDAIDQDEFDQLWNRANDALFETLDGQEQARDEQDPVARLFNLLQSALATGQAHLVADFDEKPHEMFGAPELWGYHKITRRVPVNTERTPTAGTQANEDADEFFEDQVFIEPRGKQIGWRHEDNIYFDRDASMAVAQLLARDAGQPPLPFAKKALGKRLAQDGKLASSTGGRNTLKRSIDGVEREVWHVSAYKFYDFFRADGSWAERLDNEISKEKEEFEQRQAERARAIEHRRNVAGNYATELFMQMLDLRPVDDEQSRVQAVEEDSRPEATPVRGEEDQPGQEVAIVDQLSEDQPGVQITEIHDNSDRAVSQPRRTLIQPGRQSNDFFLD